MSDKNALHIAEIPYATLAGYRRTGSVEFVTASLSTMPKTEHCCPKAFMSKGKKRACGAIFIRTGNSLPKGTIRRDRKSGGGNTGQPMVARKVTNTPPPVIDMNDFYDRSSQSRGCDMG